MIHDSWVDDVPMDNPPLVKGISPIPSHVCFPEGHRRICDSEKNMSFHEMSTSIQNSSDDYH